jgi:two-component system OmpR family sensor kinase/two-component system phosphate regulon sensor histidine kinase PhoR
VEASDWNMLGFSILVLLVLAYILNRYARRMDERISREQAAKENEMRRQLTHNIAHELKTPVASILGYSETLLDHPDLDDETRQQFIKRTQAQAQRLTALLKDISILNRIDYAPDVLEKENTNISVLVSEIAQETSLALAHHRMSLRNCLPEDIWVYGNPSLLYSIFRNLFDNAINYAGDNTTIEISAEKESDYWKFTFSDNGQGIAPEHLPRIFERFYRIDKGRSRSMGGTGLGLAIVKNAVLLHGGTISVSSEQGLTFTFTLKMK